MNDTVATEDQEQPAGCHQRKARVADRDPGRRTSSGPADICSAPTEAGHMTAANQIVRSAKKVLAMEGRPHMTTQSLANSGRNSLLFRKMQGEFEKMQRGANCNRAKSGHFSITCIASPYSRSRETVIGARPRASQYGSPSLLRASGDAMQARSLLPVTSALTIC